MRGPTWTDEEKEVLKKLIEEGKSNREIAQIMNKPIGGIKTQRKNLGLKTRFFHQWTVEQKQYIFENWSKTDQELADDLNIDFWAVRNFKNKHDLREKVNKWNEEEKEILVMLLSFCTHAEIAKILNRTTHSINRYCETHGFLTQPPPREIHIGDKFDRLTVTSEKYIKKFEHGSYGYVKIKCSCGSPEKETQVNALFSGMTRSCGCLARELASRKSVDNPRFQHDRGIPKVTYKISRAGAITRNLPFDISFKRFVDLFYEQNCRCIYSGLELCFYPSLKEKILQTASFDRKNSQLGYIEGNCQWIHKMFQNFKQDLDEEVFFNYCYHIINPIKNIIPNNEIFLPNNKIGISEKFFKRYIESAKARNIEFNITIEQAWQKFREQLGFCALTGLPLKLVLDYPKQRSIQTASMDRTDNTKGYTYENIQWILQDLNYLKGVLTMQEVIRRCKLIVDFRLMNYKYSKLIYNPYVFDPTEFGELPIAK